MASLSWRSVLLSAVGLVGYLWWSGKLKQWQKFNLKCWIANYVVGKTVRKLTSQGEVCELSSVTLSGETYRCFKNAPKTLPFLFAQGASHPKETEYLVYTANGARLTFLQAGERAVELAMYLKDVMGVKQGDRVALLASNCPEYVISFMAITSIGAIVVTLNSWWEGNEILHGINDSGASVLICDTKRLARVDNKLPPQDLEVIVIDRDQRASGSLAGRTRAFEACRVTFDSKRGCPFDQLETLGEINPDDDAMIMYTSGTTSAYPKGVLHSHRGMTQAIESYCLFLEIMKALKGPPKRQRCDLLTSPIFHTSGLCTILLAFRGGHKVVIVPRWRVDELVDVMVEEKVTYFAGVPTMVSDMLKSEKFIQNKGKMSFDNLGTGGAPIQPHLVRTLHQAFPAASQGTGWGMSETMAIGTVIGGPQFLATPKSCGKPQIICDVKVVDPLTLQDIKEPNVPGELCLRTPTVMKGYWGLPKETNESFLPNSRWFRSGDVGYMDEDGMVYIIDRLKDLVNRGGEKISLNEVESCVLELPQVLEVAAFGLQDERLGERLCVALLPVPGATISPQAVIDHVANRLAKFKVPESVFIRETPLPRNAVNKVLKRDLRVEYGKT